MRKNDISIYISNVLILTPAIASFIYIFPVERIYWEAWVILLFVIPFVKYFSPKDYRSKVYPLTMIVILVYILVSDLVLLTHDSFIGSGLFKYPITRGNFTPFMFTLSTGIVFPLLFEGVLSKKTSKTVSYMVVSTTSTIYMLATLTFAFNVFKGYNFYDVYELTGILIYLNVYLLIYKGYEFITLLLQPNPFVIDLLTTTFIVSIVGFILNLYFSEENRVKKSLEYLGYPILTGSIVSFILTFLLIYLPYSIYSIFVTTLIAIMVMFSVKHSDRKGNYHLKIMEDDGNKQNN